MRSQAHLLEIFSSIQGEGLLLGKRQLFVRFYGCHRTCSYCDTPEAVTAWQPRGFQPDSFAFETGNGADERIANPVTAADLLALLIAREESAGPHHSVALTGGEPLLHAPFLQEFIPKAAATLGPVYLETTGDLPKPLAQLPQKGIGWIAMDIKLPSITGDAPRWREHAGFLAIADALPAKLFVKVVAGPGLDPADLEKAVELVAAQSPHIPFVLQPVTPQEGTAPPAEQGEFRDWCRIASSRLSDVRVIPQCHKLLALR